MTKVTGQLVTFSTSEIKARLPKLKQSINQRGTNQAASLMNFNFKAIALGSLAAIALVAAPIAWTHSANADDNGRGDRFEQLNLTADQSSQIEAIRTETRSQIEAVLTSEQRAALGEGESMKRGLRSLDLTDEQREQIRAIKDGKREQIEAILTEEQRQQLAEMHARRGDRGGRLENLNLTEEQSTQIESIRADERSQMSALLTSEQRAALDDGEMGPRAWRSLDLTDEQREQMRAIHETTHEKINAVLTEEQRQQLPERGQRGNRDRQADS